MATLTYALPPYSLQLEKLCPGPSLTLAADYSLQSGEVSQNPFLTFRLPPVALKRLHLEHAQTHISQVPIYTDGSKTTDGTAFAAILPNRTVARRIPSTASIFTAELHAIWSALAGLGRYGANSFVVYSDSRSALQSVCDPFCDHPIVVEIHRWLYLLSARGKTISFCWVPSHVGEPVMRKPTELLEALFTEVSMVGLFHTNTFFLTSAGSCSTNGGLRGLLLRIINSALSRKTCLSGQHRVERRD